MNNNFDLSKFLIENKLTTATRVAEKEKKALLKEGYHSIALDRTADRLDYTKPKALTKQLSDLTFADVKAVFPDIETQGVSFPSGTDVLSKIKTSLAFEEWKESFLEKFGDITIELNPKEVWYNKVKPVDDAYKAAKKSFDIGKGDFLDRSKGSIDEETEDAFGDYEESEDELVLEPDPEDLYGDVRVSHGEKTPFNEEQVEEDFSKYATVEELMKEIENSTNEAAHKHKMERVKAAYESLEAKATSLEEGEHSAYISTSKIKEMKMSSKKLRKMYESLSKVYEKKYAKKEK